MIGSAATLSRTLDRFAETIELDRRRVALDPVSSSGYNNLGLFFEKIARFRRIINVDNIQIQGLPSATDPSRTISATCTATTFVFVEETATN